MLFLASAAVASAAGLGACTLVTDTRGLLRNALPPADASVLDGSATDANADAGTEKDGATFTPETPCPSAGGFMANVGTHCVDIVEVTIASYDTFLATFADAGAVDTKDQPAACAFNDDLRRGTSYDGSPNLADHPVAEVDWCDAYTFCKWAGKRLCGRREGGPTPYGKWTDPKESQWQAACTSNGAHPFVYGDVYDGLRCRGRDYQDQSDYVVSSRAAVDCVAPSAPYSAVYALSGNASEWEDSCETNNGPIDKCRVRGGSRADGETLLRCDGDGTADRNTRSVLIGFRCCWP